MDTNPIGKEFNIDGLTDNLYKTLLNESTLIFLKHFGSITYKLARAVRSTCKCTGAVIFSYNVQARLRFSKASISEEHSYTNPHKALANQRQCSLNS